MDKILITIFNELFDLGIEAFKEDLKMKETDEWNSLKHMELITLIEERFKIELSFDEITKMVSLKEIKAVLESKEVADYYENKG